MENNIRWNSPFEHSLPYKLFEKHFTEINKNYWASVPASCTIEKYSSDFFNTNKNKNPVDFFT